jgi:hypothetical protein
VHTNENQNKPTGKPGRGKKVAPGQQIANNKAMHCNMQLFENEQGEYYAVVDRGEQPTLVRGEYHPIGNRLHYPKQWGRKYAATTLVKHKIGVAEAIIQNAQKELEKLGRCLESIQQWSDTDE